MTLTKTHNIIALFTFIIFACMMFAISTSHAAEISETIRAEGLGSLQQPAPNGYRAAKVDAYRNLAEQIYGAKVDSDTTIKDYINQNDLVHMRVSGLIKGAKVINKYKDETGYHVIVEIPVYGTGNLMDSMSKVIESNPKNVAPQADVHNINQEIANTIQTNGNYTGVIVDCKGLELSTAMAPTIVNSSGEIIYNYNCANHDEVVRRGMVGYSKDMLNVQRAGTNPLIIKAIAVDKFVNPVVSNEDAIKIIKENSITKFLQNTNVVFIK